MNIPISKTWELVRFNPSRSFLDEMQSALIIYSATALIAIAGVIAATLVGFPPPERNTTTESDPPYTNTLPPSVAPPHFTPLDRENAAFVMSMNRLRFELLALAEKSGDQKRRSVPRVGERIPLNVRYEPLPSEVKTKMKYLGLKAEVAGVFESQNNLVLIDATRKVVSILPSSIPPGYTGILPEVNGTKYAPQALPTMPNSLEPPATTGSWEGATGSIRK